MKRVISALLTGVLVSFVFWCGGLDFTTRSIDLSFAVALIVLFSLIAFELVDKGDK